MDVYKAVIVNEIEKIYKRKKAIAIIIISFLAIIAGQLIVIGTRSGWGLGVVGGAQFSLLVLDVFNNSILPLFTALAAIDMFTGEFSHNTMKITLTMPVSRFKVYLGKITAIAFFILVNLLIIMLMSLLAGILFNPSDGMIREIPNIIVSYIVSAIPMLVLALMIVFFANLLKSSTSVFFIAILVFLACKVLGIAFPKYSSFFITSLLDWYKLWIASSLPFFKLLREFLMMAGYAIIFFTAGFYLFEKKNL